DHRPDDDGELDAAAAGPLLHARAVAERVERLAQADAVLLGVEPPLLAGLDRGVEEHAQLGLVLDEPALDDEAGERRVARVVGEVRQAPGDVDADAEPVLGGRRLGRLLDGVEIRGRLLRAPDGGDERDGENQAKGHGTTRRYLNCTRHAPWATSSARIRLSSY